MLMDSLWRKNKAVKTKKAFLKTVSDITLANSLKSGKVILTYEKLPLQ